LLQISVEVVIDTCALLVTGLRLGLPAEEDDLFETLGRRGVVSAAMAETLRRMKGLRNLLGTSTGASTTGSCSRRSTRGWETSTRSRERCWLS
jgi:hypothetical protein